MLLVLCLSLTYSYYADIITLILNFLVFQAQTSEIHLVKNQTIKFSVVQHQNSAPLRVIMLRLQRII
jgi:hypothetical protein